MYKKYILNEKEHLFLHRKGDILHTIGLFRCLFVNDLQITKDKYIFYVKENYNLKKLDENFLTHIDKVWKNVKPFLEDLDILIRYTDNYIKIKEPIKCFDI